MIIEKTDSWTKRLTSLAFASLLVLTVAACDNGDDAEDAAEDAGDAVGDAAEDAGDAVEDATN